ncbi:MAG: hypothetical protein Kow0063_40310 [Anaerolineae bacterium]
MSEGTEMQDEYKTRQQLVSELVLLREQIAELRASEAGSRARHAASQAKADGGEIDGGIEATGDTSDHARTGEVLRRRAEELDALQATVLDITTEHELSRLLETIVERAVRLLKGTGGGMYLCDPVKEEARCVVSYKISRDISGVVLKYGEGAAGQVAQTGQPLIIEDYRTWSGRAAVFEEGQPFTAVLSAPMVWQGQVTGVIHVLGDVESRRFTRDDLALLTIFANHAAVAVENARLFEAEQKRRRIAETLRQASTVLNSTLELGQVLELILGQLQHVIPYDTASLQRLQDEGLRIVACRGFEEASSVVGLVFPLDPKFPNHQVITTRAALAIDDISQQYPHFRDEAETYESGHICSWLGAPLMVKDQIIGMLALDRVEVRPFSEEEVQLAMAFASQAAIAIENARLFEETQRYRTFNEGIVQTVPGAILATNVEGNFTFINPATTELVGYTPQELLGKHWSVIFPAEQHAIVQAADQRRMRGESDQYEAELLRKDGSRVPVLISGSPWFEPGSDRFAGTLAVLTDISQRVNAQAALHRSERLFHTLINSLPQNVFSKDLEGRFTFANQSYCATEGRRLEDILGKTDFDLHPPELARKYREDDRRVIETGQVFETVEKHHPLDRGVSYVQVVKAPVYDAKGEISGILGIFWDITQRRRAEQLLQVLNQTSQAMEQALTPEDIFAAIAEEFRKLGLSYVVFLVDESGRRLRPRYLNFPGQVVKAAEKLAGVTTESFSFLIEEVDVYKQVVWERKTVFLEDVEEALRQTLPAPARRFTRQIMKKLNMSRFVATPLIVEDQVIGVFTVQSDDLAADDVPAITAFGHQVAAAWRKAQLYEQARQELVEREQAEEEIRRLKDFNEGIVQNMTEGITVEDGEGYFTFVNPAAATLLGYTPEELIGQHWTVIVPADQHQIVQSANARRRRGESDQYELELVHKDGRRIPVLISGSPRYEGGDFAGTLAVFADISERVQAERELRRRNRGLALLNQIIAASASDLEVEAMLGTACQELSRTFDAPRASAFIIGEGKTEARLVAEHVSGGQPPSKDVTIPIKGNPLFQYLLSNKAPLLVRDAQDDPRLEPIYDLIRQNGTRSLLMLPLVVEGEVVGGLELDAFEPSHFSADDVSLAWSAADQMAGALARARLNEQRQRLEERYRQAQKMEAVGRLTAGIAHDFNNLLTAINGFAELARLQLLPDDPLHEMVEKILHSGRRAADLVRQLLAFSRKQIIEPQVLDLNAVVANMDKMLRRVIGEDIELETRLASDLWAVKADPTQIEQVIVNLAINARDAMPDGGQLIIETANVTVGDDAPRFPLQGPDEELSSHVLEVQAGDYVMLTVSDTGVGMNEEVRSHLFEPFFTTKEPGKGTGLGLATVYGVVRQAGGDIQVCSQEGQGASFKVYLPRVREATPMPVRPRGIADAPSGDETILVVEDDESVRDLTRRVLEGQGYHVLQASNGHEAIQVFAGYAGPIHLLVTDLIMPGISGKLLSEQLRQAHPDLKVLFMSGYTDELIAGRGVLEPGVVLLQKPFRPLDLTLKVRQILDAP